KFSGTIYEYLVSPVGWIEVTLGFVGAAAKYASIDADFVAETCAHSLLDAVGRVPGIPRALADAVSAQQR
ncbi:MAG: hypothetical protein U1C73_09355, partial [Dietzia sp.]|nr:hypothetical protein [Dietzia sp.]